MSLHPGIWSFFMRHVCFFNCHCVLEVWVFEEFLSLFFLNWKKGKTSPTASRGNMQKTKCLTQRPPSPRSGSDGERMCWCSSWKGKQRPAAHCPQNPGLVLRAGLQALTSAVHLSLGAASSPPVRLYTMELGSTFFLFSSHMSFYTSKPRV